jgi:hypothetical protein
LLSNVPKPEVSDTTGDDESAEVRQPKHISCMKQYFSLQYWKGQRLLLLTFLLLHVVVASIHISNEGITADEPDYYSYAAHWAHGNMERTDKMYDSKSPVVAIALLPRIIKQILHPDFRAVDYGVQDVKNGRYFMVIFTIIIACYLFVWTRKLFGPTAWILPVLFFLFDPTVISFSMIITSDMATGACLIATMYHLFKFCETRSRKQFIIFSLWLGVSFVCKASLLFLLPCLMILYVLLLLAGKIKWNGRKLFLYGLLLCVISLLVINLAYFGKDSFRTLNNIHFQSTRFQKMADVQVINKIPIPVPENYIVALDLLQYHAEIGGGKTESSYPGVILNGHLKQHGGFCYYYLEVGLYKIPVSILILLGASFLIFILRFQINKFFFTYIWLAWPAFFLFTIMSCFNDFQIGFRHFLLIYPLLFIGIAAAIKFLKNKFKFALPITWLLFAYMIISTAFYFPNFIAYTNEFILDKKNVFRTLCDASVDYGQNDNALQNYILQHANTKLPGTTPAAGKYIVPMSQLIQTSSSPDHSWLLQFDPVSHYKYTLLIFDISQKNIDQLQQKSRP